MFSTVAEAVENIAQAALDEFQSNPRTYLKKIGVEIDDVSAHPLLGGPAWEDAPADETLQPIPGSVVYTDLIPGYMQHSGIYVGDDCIVELNREGEIRLVGQDEFTCGGLGVRIHVSSAGGRAVGSATVAERALAQVGRHRDYHLLLNNCHQFSSGCLTGDFANADNLLRTLKHSVLGVLGADEWRVWRGRC